MVMTASSIQAGFEPIPGYILRNKLGVGGYGEVWLADAPGGLKKAIKFVHGNIDESKAASELKSLQRIRQVNHPFILSLERIEVIDGQLMIVTELANGTLHDRFVEYRERSFVGIPRDRLLDYLRDAADGLDFLCQQHDLQHLDVKPANLLLVADRVKVADFGLIKDVQSNSLSMMGGLTPTYAAPEMFDGRPGRFSDQYSLAIVYQELLTGTLPFRGRTTAQLANEHLHKAPCLEPIPLLERPILSKALAKKPQMRFSDCRELIKALERVQSDTSESNEPVGSGRKAHGSASKQNKSRSQFAFKVKPNRVQANRESPEVFSEPKTDNVVTLQREVRSVETLPELEPADICDSPNHAVSEEMYLAQRKSLIIGLGGTGAHALVSMRNKIVETNPERLSHEQLGFLLIDSDQSSIERASNREFPGCMSYHSLVHIPLKPPIYYRQNSDSQFPQLSRRWVYNVPRALKTEGVRPLGMLAFLDHAPLVFESLHDAIVEVAQSNGVEKSHESIVVQIVSSAHGGTGSSIAAEVGFLVQQLAAELEVPVDIELLLTCAAPMGLAATDLMSATALSCLTEIHHYFATGGLHPSLEQLPDSRAINQPPFDQVNLVYGGQCGNDRDWMKACEEVAEYLYASTESILGARIVETRKKHASEQVAEHAATPWLGTLSVRSCDISTEVSPLIAASRYCLRAILPWLSTLRSIKSQRLEQTDAQNPTIDPKLSESIDCFVTDLFRSNHWTAQAWVNNCIACLLPNEVEVPPPTAESDGTEDSSTDSKSVLCTEQKQELAVVCEQLAIDPENAFQLVSNMVLKTRATLADWLVNRWLNHPPTWQQLKCVLRMIANKFSVNANSLSVVAQKIAQKHDALLDQVYSSSEQPNPEFEKQLHAMALEARFHSMASKMLTRMGEHVAYLEDLMFNELELLERDLLAWANELSETLDMRLDESPQSRSAVESLLQSDGTDKLNKIVRNLVQTVSANRLGSVFGLETSSDNEEKQAPKTFSDVMDFVVCRFTDKRTLASNGQDDSSRNSRSDSPTSKFYPTTESVPNTIGTATLTSTGSVATETTVRRTLSDEIDDSLPYLVEFGGAVRNGLLLSTVQAEQLDVFQKADIESKHVTTIVNDHRRDSAIICLGEQLILSEIMDRVWVPTTDVWQLAHRLLARVDIDWLPVQPLV